MQPAGEDSSCFVLERKDKMEEREEEGCKIVFHAKETSRGVTYLHLLYEERVELVFYVKHFESLHLLDSSGSRQRETAKRNGLIKSYLIENE